MTKPLLIEHDDGIDRVTLNRPENLNALNPDMIDALNGYFEGLQRNRSTRVVVLKGAGASFCAGLDLKHAMARRAGQQEPPDVTESLDSQRRIADIVLLMRRCPQPIIALVQGSAAGGGFALALAADIRIATKSARMNCAFIKLGLGGCDIGTSYFLPRLVGVSVASELILTGRFIHAERALAVGLVSEVVEEGGLDAAAAPYVEAMMMASPVGLRLSKECLNMSVDAGSIEAVIAMEDRNQVLCSRSEDFNEGIRGLSGKAKACLYQAVKKTVRKGRNKTLKGYGDATMSGNAAAVLTKPAFRKIEWLQRDIAVERRPDGVIILKSRIPLQPYEKHIPASLTKWADAAPSRTWLAQRSGADRQWRKLSYGEAKRTVDGLTQGLLDLKLELGSPVAILSGNSIEHALMTMAAMQARFPAAPVSPAYSLMSQDHLKLKYLFDLIKPKVVMVQDGPAFEKALKALNLEGVTVIHVARPCEGIESTAFADLAATPVTTNVEDSIAKITPDTVGKLLFTSGSTGMPKAVINTQAMMCANAAMMMQVRPRDPNAPLATYLDWMPWNHTMGGNALFNPVLTEGGTLYIDDGRPMPGLIDETLRNLREISPTYYANVPAGYAALAAAMEKDDALCRGFFRNLGLMAYGGARLPDDLFERMQALAVRATGERIVFYTGWGSTETAPTSTGTYWDTERVGLIGLPFPGVELKMVPVGDKYELRLRGVNVTPGYFGRPDLTEAAFDEEGFYCIGDAGVFVDPQDPMQGIIFAGRVVEDFKLTTGTFVHVGSLRTDAIAAATPVVQDALVAGQDRPFVGLLAWPNLHACRQIVGNADASFEDVVRHPEVLACLKRGLEAHNKSTEGASSMRVARAILMIEPASIDGNELTDKGYINQRAGLERRAALVERLYADPPGEDVIVLN